MAWRKHLKMVGILFLETPPLNGVKISPALTVRKPRPHQLTIGQPALF
jgi:hypothetical protein